MGLVGRRRGWWRGGRGEDRGAAERGGREGAGRKRGGGGIQAGRRQRGDIETQRRGDGEGSDSSEEGSGEDLRAVGLVGRRRRIAVEGGKVKAMGRKQKGRGADGTAATTPQRRPRMKEREEAGRTRE